VALARAHTRALGLSLARGPARFDGDAVPMDDAASDLLLLIICSPSGAGKTTLTRDFLRHFKDFTFSVSCTTRKPRSTEVDGRDYFFIEREEFQRRVEQGKFVEWAEVHGNYYGTSLSELDRARSEDKAGVVFDVDYQGARQIKAKLPHAVGVFILPPSLEELGRRLRGRATDDEATIQRRFAKARVEIEHYRLFDYVIVNDDYAKASDRLRSVVYAEASRCARLAPAAERLLRDGSVGAWPFQGL
jgi:guanylate kinase